jgi:GntR family transcriptional regulator, gluconate operon transcriptional repressor
MLELTPLQQTALGERVAHELRVAIVSGRLQPGQHLVEAKLSETFSVSRGPVRDALRVLEAEGLVESRRRGVFVVGLDDADIKELYVLRESLESLALRLMLERADAGPWRPLEDAIQQMNEAADRKDAAAFAEADLAFHSHFYLLSGNRRLLSVWNHFRPTFTVLLQVTTAQDRDLHPSADSHVEILRNVTGGNLDGALTELSEHLLGAENRLRAAHEEVRNASKAERER